MAVINSGKAFASGEQLTADKLNLMFTGSNFSTGAIDSSTISLNSEGKLTVNAITSSNIADNALNLSKIQQIDTDKVLGKLSAGTGDIEEITVDEDLTSVSANHDQLATSKAIKDYIDAQITATLSKTIGYNQTWSIVNRSFDITYNNNQDQPIIIGYHASGPTDNHEVYVNITPSGGSTSQVLIGRSTNSGGGVASAGSILVPGNSTYRYIKGGDGIDSVAFYELS